MSNTTPNPADKQMNQYTTVPRGAPAGSVTMELEHDLNGNLKLIPFQADDETTPVLATATYDYRNLMVKYERDGMTAEYAYDALGRRIEKTLDDGEDTTTTLYLHRGYQEIEERDGEEEVLATYVHGNGIDEVLNMQRDGEDYFYHADDQGTVWAITDDEGAVTERYDYQDYGETYVLTPAGAAQAESELGHASRYTGRRFDPESGLYWYRTRYYDPATARFTSRDVIGIWGDSRNLGLGYAYVGHNPWSFTDPLGLCVPPPPRPRRPKLDCEATYRKCLRDAHSQANADYQKAWNTLVFLSNVYSLGCVDVASNIANPRSRGRVFIACVLGAAGGSLKWPKLAAVFGAAHAGNIIAYWMKMGAIEAYLEIAKLDCKRGKKICEQVNKNRGY